MVVRYISYEIALRWMPLNLTDDKSTLIQVMAWCRQATSHYLIQFWPSSMSPYGVTRPQWDIFRVELHLLSSCGPRGDSLSWVHRFCTLDARALVCGQGLSQFKRMTNGPPGNYKNKKHCVMLQGKILLKRNLLVNPVISCLNAGQGGIDKNVSHELSFSLK